MKKLLFISGCPRSGTSALTELITAHEKIVIGMERYKYLYGKADLKQELFEEEKFFNFKEDETNITDRSGKYREFYANLKTKFSNAQVFGDKTPMLYLHFEKINNTFLNNVKFIHIIRDIEDVASSFNVRALNEKDRWPRENDYKKAVEIWNKSLLVLVEALSEGIPILPVFYEDIFADTKQAPLARKAMCQFIGVKDSAAIYRAHKTLLKNYKTDIHNKVKTTLPGQKEYLDNNCHFDLLKKIRSITSQ